MDNLNEPVGESKNKKLFIILGLVLVVAIIIVAAVMSRQQGGMSGGDEQNSNVPSDAKPYIPNGSATDENGAPVEGAENAEGDAMAGEEVQVPEILKEAVIVVEGANPISKDGLVITPQGNEVKNDANPMSQEAPRQTLPLDKAELPASTIKLDVNASGWSPNEFRVKAGAPVTLAVSSIDQYTHIFKFQDPALSAVAIGLNPGETRAMTFNAPKTPGEYPFFCDVPGHAGRGETGKMIVE